jgi:hypothetical protein
MYTSILKLNCHVKPDTSAIVTIVIDGISQQFDLLPTINWVPSSSTQDSREILINLPVTSNTVLLATVASNTLDFESEVKDFDFEIKAEHTDILICGYNCSHGSFDISTQPVWDAPAWQPYDISGHTGDSPSYSGPGSLQILNGQTVRFTGTLTIQLNPPAP